MPEQSNRFAFSQNGKGLAPGSRAVVDLGVKLAGVYPFRGIRYNQEIVGDLAQVICPPYDIITPEQQKLCYERSDYNAIRLEYPLISHCEPKVRAEAISGDKYSQAAITFQQWLKQGVLQVDNQLAFYLHDHCFEYLGEKIMRRGLMARVKLEPWGNGIYPHEETFLKAKNDRLQLLRSCRANFSPLLSLYQDPEQKIASILSKVSQGKPVMSLRAEAASQRRSNLPDSGEEHIVWAITDASLTHEISQLLCAQPLYMADGHHRYETALTYQRERARCHPERSEGSPMEAFDYVMMTLVSFSDPGLVLLPVHRLVRGISPAALAGLKEQLEIFFSLESIPLAEVLPSRSEPFTASVIAGSSLEPKLQARAPNMVLAILGLEPQSLVVLKHPQSTLIEAMMPGNRSNAYKRFGIGILNHVILERILGFKCNYSSGASAPEEENIAYSVDIGEAYRQIKEGNYQLAFLLSPPQPGVIKVAADARDRMPRKSTYFYPKLPAGLIINSV